MEFLIAIVILFFLFLIAKAGIEESEKIKRERIRSEEERIRKEEFNNRDPEAAEVFINKLIDIVDEKKFKLLEERRKLVKKDSYGNESFSRWFGDPPLEESHVKFCLVAGIFDEFKKGVPYFWMSTILKRIGATNDNNINAEIYFKEWKNYCLCNPEIDDLVKGKKRRIVIEDWYAVVLTLVENKCRELLDKPSSKNLKKDMTGVQFEEHCKKILIEAGWEVEDTPTSGDQGVDLIASIENLRVCIQCKCFTKPVGNKAVQEVAAGMIHWNGTHAVVVGKSGFTKSAQNLAESTKVILTSDSELENLENLVL